jgi:putative dimethyl sulfoxide reductase chaperone
MTKKNNDKQPNTLKGYNMLLYFAGTMITFDPSKECINDFWTEGILKSLPVSSANPRFVKAAAQLHQSVDDQTSNIKMMKQDYLSLFSGGIKPLAPPCESVYRIKNHLEPDKHPSEVTEFYKSYGWESKFKGSIPDDHLGVELLFLTLMIEKYLEIDDEICNSEMRNEIRRFIGQHLLSWIPTWNQNVQEHAFTLSYKGIGSLILACAEDLYNIMSKTDKNFN